MVPSIPSHGLPHKIPDSPPEAWFDGQLDLDPARLVFIDETWTATNMTRSHGRCRRGKRLRMGYPHGHRKTTTLVAGLRMTGMIAPMVLVPELEPGEVFIMDNLSSHKRASVSALIQAAGARLLFLAALQPRLQPDREGLRAPHSHAPQSW